MSRFSSLLAKTLPVLVVVVALWGQLGSPPETGGATPGVSLSGLNVLQTDAEHTRMRFTLTSIEARLGDVGGVVLHDAHFQGAVSRGEAGFPNVPVVRALVAIPECRQIELHYSVANETAMNGIDLRPAPGTRRDADGRMVEVYNENPAVYDKNEEYPGDIFRVVSLGHLRGQRLALVEIAPVQYNPVQQRLRVINDVTLEIRTVEPEGSVFKSVGPMDALLSGIVENAHQGGPSPASALDGPLMSGGAGDYQWCEGSTLTAIAQSINQFGTDYLIIAAEEVATTSADSTLIDQLASRRAEYNGFNVAIVRLDQIDNSPNTTSTPDSIRTLIKSVYDEQSAAHMGDGRLGYVLLIGDAWNPAGDVLLPSYYGFPEVTGNELTACSDAYYSLMGDDPFTDPFPDIYIGRLPVDADGNDSEMNNVVSKILAYEPLPEQNAWTDKILMVSGNYLGASYGQEYFEYVTDNAVPSDKSVAEIHREIDFLSDEECSNAVADSLESGYWIASFIGHGSPFYLGETFYQKHSDVLQNTAFPVITFFACEMGQFDLNSDSIDIFCSGSPGYGCTDDGYPESNLACYKPPTVLDGCDSAAERLVLQANGAIGTFAYTRKQAGANAKHDFYYHQKALSEENATTLGDLLLAVKLFSSNYVSLYIYTLFGDPALNIRWKDVVHDSVDVAIRSSDIRGRQSTKYLNSDQTDDVVVTFRNLGMKDADDVSFEIWLGDPADSSSSTRLDSLTVTRIPAHGEFTGEYSVTLSSPGLYPIYIKLDPADEIAERAEDNNVAGMVLAALPYHETSFPVRTGAKHYYPPCIRNVTGHPGEEILVTSLTDIRCYGEDGSERWSFRRRNSDGNKIEKRKNGPVVANFLKDSNQFVLFETGDPSRVYLLHGSDGTVADSMATGDSLSYYIGMGYGIGDLVTGDTDLDFVTFDDQDLVAFEIAGSEIWRTQIATISDNNKFCSIAVADLDGNGDTEIVLATVEDLMVLDADTNTTEKTWSIGVSYNRRLALIDADDDGDLEILVNAVSNGYKLQLYHHNISTPIWEYPIENDSHFSAGDIDANGDIEIVVVSQDRIRVLSAAGQLLNSAALDTGKFVSTPLLVDIDGDSECEIITNTVYDGDPDHDNYVPFDAHDIGVIRVYDNNLTAVGDTLSYFAYAGWAPGLAVGDLDDDGEPELVFLSSDSALHVVDLGSSMGVAEWPQSYNNAMNTNLYQQPLIGTYAESVSLFNRVRVLGDVNFNESVYINPGTDLYISKLDASSGGIDEEKIEIRGFKELRVTGTAAHPVRFVAADSLAESEGTDDWSGIFVHDDTADSGATLGYFNNTIVRNATVGISTNVGCEIDSCLIELCDLIGISIARADTVRISHTTIRDAELVGVNLLQGTVAFVQDCTIEAGRIRHRGLLRRDAHCRSR